jgi:hypothetical protein
MPHSGEVLSKASVLFSDIQVSPELIPLFDIKKTCDTVSISHFESAIVLHTQVWLCPIVDPNRAGQLQPAVPPRTALLPALAVSPAIH